MEKAIIDKNVLYNEYIIQEKTMKQIAKEYNIAVGSVYNYIKKYNIESRKHLTEKQRKKLSEMRKGIPSKKKGTKLSEETKLKMSIAKKGKFRNPSKFGGARKHRQDGYISVFLPTHPNASKDGFVMEHILIMENHIGRILKEDEVVHHKNKIRDDNRIENLELMTFKEHARLHMIERHELKRQSKLKKERE